MSESENEHHTTELYSNARPTRSWGRVIVGLLVLLLVSIAGGYYVYQLTLPPNTFPANEPIIIESGMGVRAIASQLAAAQIVRSETLLYLVFLANHEPTTLKASTYIFSEPLNVFEVADRIAAGDFTSDLIRVTHVEGDSVAKLAPRLATQIDTFDTAAFIEQATPYEGTLFPDTYYIPPQFTTNALITLMRERYEEALIPLKEAIAAHPLSEAEIVILASIIEREANSPESMRMVSGILQNRLEIGMALQVDASIEYELDKPLSELTPEDLERDSPYNTYLYTGLPPTPIGNPGLAAITAVLEPTVSDNLFYITGRDGTFYYATNFDDHRRNIERYLR